GVVPPKSSQGTLIFGPPFLDLAQRNAMLLHKEVFAVLQKLATIYLGSSLWIGSSFPPSRQPVKQRVEPPQHSKAQNKVRTQVHYEHRTQVIRLGCARGEKIMHDVSARSAQIRSGLYQRGQ